MATLPPPPTFFIIGMRHNATRWLRFNLGLHPDICAPPIQTDFYLDLERMQRLGLRWFREQFHDWDGEAHIGEACPTYAEWGRNPLEVATRMRKHLPDARLVAIIGEPVARFHAELRHLIRWGEIPADVDVEAFYRLEAHRGEALRTMSMGIQSSGLSAFHSQFDDQLKVVLLDDIRADPAAVYADVLGHLGADPSFVPPDLDVVRFRDDLVVDIAPPDLASHQQIYEWYRPDVAHLERLLDIDLSAWDPGSDLVTYSPEELFRHVFGAADADEPASSG